MQSRVAKWGNSLGVRIPRTMAEHLHMAEGTPIDVVQRDNEIVIRRKQYSLEELLDKVTVENTHSETDWGKPMGRETW